MKPSRKLQQQWAKKLKSSGFSDIEKANGKLKDYHSISFSEISPEEYAEKQNYFALARQLGNGYSDEFGNWIDVFSGNERDRQVWFKYCEGISERNIAKQIKLSDRTIRRIIQKYNKFIVQ